MKRIGARLAACALVTALIGACAHKVYGDPDLPVAGKVLGTVVHTRDAEELRYVVLQQLTERYAQQQGIGVTQAEKDAYVRHVKDALAKDRRENAARRAGLASRLAAGGLSDTERSRLASEVAALDEFLAALGNDAATADPQEAEARQQVAAAFILQWKINRAIYRQYGGRVIFQQGGPEPLDAYRRFLEEAQSRGDFSIVSKHLEAAFWSYYRDDGIHSFYPPGSREEAQVFDTPPWLSR